MSKQETEGVRNWYAIHTYAGYENVVLRNLKQRIDSLGMHEKIFNVVVPVEKKIKIKAGKRVEVEEKIYPGYVLVDMIVTDDSWYVVRNTPRVTGFVGAGVNPVPLKKDEVDYLFKKMDSNTAKHNIDLAIDENVLICLINTPEMPVSSFNSLSAHSSIVSSILKKPPGSDQLSLKDSAPR